MVSQSENSPIFDLNANLKRKFEYVGGKLKITDSQLFFHPHKVNVQSSDTTINIEDIISISEIKIFGLSPNGVKIELKDGSSFKFVIGAPGSNKRREVIDFINNK